MLEYTAMSALPIILASASPRRRELLALGGWAFEVQTVDVLEIPLRGESPDDFVQRMSVTKTQAAISIWNSSAEARPTLVIGADTVVTIDGKILGKPAGPQNAVEMLTRLRDQVHAVLTGLCIAETATGKTYTDLARSAVPMRAYSPAEVAAYVATGDPLDKAGAYAIQHPAFHPVDEAQFSDCFANVMGLPLCHLLRRLRRLGVEAQTDLPAACQRFIPYTCPVFETILKENIE
jgi:septum formation protein